ncbi:MAG TPA: hypothetical protein EYG03_00735 [Planctomycetes bacterium]|nr:hypothetical protein [Planctomycetota bacterium]
MAKANKKTVRSIDDLKEEYERLNERKIQAQTQLEEATKQLEALQKEAIAEFETSEIDELKSKLEQMEAENEKRRSDYQELLEKISGELAKVEQKAAPQTKSGNADDA